MSLFSKSKSKSNATADKQVADAQSQLQQKTKTLEGAQAAFTKAETELATAHNENAATATLQKSYNDAEGKLKDAQFAYDAAADKLKQAEQDAINQAHQGELKKLHDALETRSELARKLADNAVERARLFDQFAAADEIIRQAHSHKLTNPAGMPGHNFGRGHLDKLMELEDGRVGLPNKPTGWTERGHADFQSCLVDAVKRDNDVIRPEDG